MFRAGAFPVCIPLDVFASAIQDLMSRVNELEGRVTVHNHREHVHAPVNDAWEEIEFKI